MVNRENLHQRIKREIEPNDTTTISSGKIVPYKLTTRNRRDDVYVWFPMPILFEDSVLDYIIDKIADDTKTYHLKA